MSKIPWVFGRIQATYLEGLGLEIAEGNGLIEVGVIDALEGADRLRFRSVVLELIWKGAV